MCVCVCVCMRACVRACVCAHAHLYNLDKTEVSQGYYYYARGEKGEGGVLVLNNECKKTKTDK